MKIRIKGNSIRYRLTKSEVEAFYQNGYLEERTEFNNRTFIYALKAMDDSSTLSATFTENTITMNISDSDKTRWYETDQVGFSFDFRLNSGAVLQLLIEKDFACLDETVEDQSDNYPNPNIAK